MNSKIEVIHTHFHNRRTGVTRSIENIIPFLQKNCNVYLYGYSIAGKILGKKNFKKIIFSKNTSIVHCHRNNEIVKMLFFRLLGAKFKLVTTRHAATKPSALTLFLLRKSDAVVTLTNAMSKQLQMPNKKIPHGVNTDIFFSKKDVTISTITEENFILCAGRIREDKGQEILVKASIDLLKNNKNWALAIVGKVDDFEFLKVLQDLIVRNSISNQVYFIDETLDIVSYYQASKIVVVPSYTEGFSLVCAEAMACGKTVIATKNVGIHSQIIQNRHSGYLFDVGNSQELASILKDLIATKLPCVGTNAESEINNNWSSKTEAKALYYLYRDLL